VNGKNRRLLAWQALGRSGLNTRVSKIGGALIRILLPYTSITAQANQFRWLDAAALLHGMYDILINTWICDLLLISTSCGLWSSG
jgi:hypothetical protein